ncbi:DUF4259 domain-containing protein [Deinococcus altitudinis]|uniref:DUF4259 domain-containing protein n=1 Tax=Deinococcus altitudinis TaxID=468914 RepID=UPI0038924055
MGTWGAGNFDNDTAADHVSQVVSRLVQEITEAIEDPSSLEPDEYGGTMVPCNVELLTLIVKQGWTGAELNAVTISNVRAWKSTYMGVWEQSIDELDPKAAWKIERRQVLELTFDALIQIAES